MGTGDVIREFSKMSFNEVAWFAGMFGAVIVAIIGTVFADLFQTKK